MVEGAGSQPDGVGIKVLKLTTVVSVVVSVIVDVKAGSSIVVGIVTVFVRKKVS